MILPPSERPARPTRTINGETYEVAPSGALLGRGGASPYGWHSIEAYMRCPKEYQFKHVRKIGTPQVATPNYFAVGSMLHAGRARWFAEDFDTSEATWQMIREDVRRTCLEQKLPVNLSAEREGLKLIDGYINWYSKLMLPKPIVMEYLVGPVALWPEFETTRMTARLDDVSWYAECGQIAIGEVKTTSGKISDTIKQYEMHGQPILQQILLGGTDSTELGIGVVQYTVLDVIKKPDSKSGSPEFARHVLDFSGVDKRSVIDSIAEAAAQARATFWGDYQPRNLTACTRPSSFGRLNCEYKDLCRFGADAAGGYVFEDGRSLTQWKKFDKEPCEPWR